MKLSLSGRENISRQRLVEKALKFQQESRALGLHLKGSVRTPRKLMDLKLVQKKVNNDDENTNDEGGETKSEEKKMLSAPRWQVRMAIGRCTGLLLTIKTLIDSGARSKQSQREKSGLVRSLAKELGITTVRTGKRDDNEKDTDETKDANTDTAAKAAAATTPSTDIPEAVCDPAVLKSIAVTTKGRRMLCRALPLLNPVQMRALVIAAMRILPTLVAQGNPKDIESATNLQLRKEAWWKALLDEKVSELLSRGFGTAMMPFPADAQPAFDVLPVALSALMDAHDDETLQKLVQTRGGATAIQDFLARGQNYCVPHPDFSKTWKDLYQTFIKRVTKKK